MWGVYFPMYVLPEVVRDMRRLWELVKWQLERAGWQDLPDSPGFHEPFTEGGVPEQLLLVQYCSYPYLKIWREKGAIKPLACFDYLARHAGEGFHQSVVIVPATSDAVTLRDLQGKTAAFNSADSNTGMNLLRLNIAPYAKDGRFFKETLVTGAHVKSVEAVADGKADIASVDGVTFAYIEKHQPDLAARVKILGVSRRAPTLPLFVANDLPDDACAKIYRAFSQVINDAENAPLVRERLHITGIRPVNDAQLEISLDYEKEARKLGYPELR